MSEAEELCGFPEPKGHVIVKHRWQHTFHEECVKSTGRNIHRIQFGKVLRYQWDGLETKEDY